MVSVDDDKEPDGAPSGINITAHGDRRTLEALYLQLREMAKQNGLRIEYRLSLTKPTE
jgi:hypothetical protein